MKELLIGDCHFGTHTNKTLWLNTQIEFFENQVYPLIDKVDRIVFLGDLFDIRYSTNTQVGNAKNAIVINILVYLKNAQNAVKNLNLKGCGKINLGIFVMTAKKKV